MTPQEFNNMTKAGLEARIAALQKQIEDLQDDYSNSILKNQEEFNVEFVNTKRSIMEHIDFKEWDRLYHYKSSDSNPDKLRAFIDGWLQDTYFGALALYGSYPEKSSWTSKQSANDFEFEVTLFQIDGKKKVHINIEYVPFSISA